MTLVERLQKECDRHTIGYPGPRREVAETLQLAADEIERLEKALETAREAAIDEAAKVAEADFRTTLAKAPGRRIAAAIRTLSQKKEG